MIAERTIKNGQMVYEARIHGMSARAYGFTAMQAISNMLGLVYVYQLEGLI